MTYHYTNNQPILTSAARTSSGQSSGFLVAGWLEGVLLLNISAASGTGRKLALRIDVSWDNSTFYTLQGIGPYEFTGTGTYAIPASNFGKYMRINYTISGTSASFTFDISLLGKT